MLALQQRSKPAQRKEYCQQLEAVDMPMAMGSCPGARRRLATAYGTPAGGGRICCDNNMPGHLAEMSDGINKDVIRTESEGMNKDRMEMIVEIYENAECVRDHDFRTETNTPQPLQRTGSVCVKIRSSRAAAVCLVLLCVLLLTAVIVLCVTFTLDSRQLISKNENLTTERDQLLTNITNLTQERDGLKIKTKNLTNERDQLLNKNTALKNKTDELIKERDQINQERNELRKMLNEMGGYIYQSSFYFISSEERDWAESRRYCTERGADLIIINNREEQEFVKKISGGTGVWIGLTDSDVEGRWKWVDGTNMTSGFWESGEPKGQRAENCALLFSSGWHDYPCNSAFKSICEKNI
ncbi:asialoglycoprotein receptor 1-like [Chanodichthys erythropterus]|uniref:asialoglycoprotein receptor 1-like n=1 Tax=Chanodichthys erythropterus TaxID=933992 RepID=UPI00351F2818